MKKFTKAVLAGLICLGISGTAQAVNLNPDGLGQVLFYPYYTVNGGNNTLISVVNTTDQAKAVKVRFMEGQNSREVLDFNLYLSARDVWTGAITKVGNTPTLIINDTSCTSPYLFLEGSQAFLPYALDDGGPKTLARTTEGHIEIIEMGVVIGDFAKDITHVTVKDKVEAEPFDCEAIQTAWTGPKGTWFNDSSVDMLPPSGGLFGGVSIINVEKGTLYSYSAVAINGFADETVDIEDLHKVPGTVFPSLDSGNVKTGTVFLANGDTYTAGPFARGVDAITFVLMRDQLMDEYMIDDILGAKTEWVVTFPTKSFYVDEDIAPIQYVTIDNEEIPQTIPPFTSIWDGDGACETVLFDIWDREEQGIDYDVSIPPVVSPAISRVEEVGIDLCYETTVIQFSPKNLFFGSILYSNNVVYVEPKLLGFDKGWASLLMYETVDSEGDYYFREGIGGLAGLPAVGVAFTEYSNNYITEEGVKANYNSIFTHKSTVAPDCENFDLQVCE